MIIATVVVCAATQPPQATAAAAQTCFGRAATIVGTAGDDVLRGTAGDDVIVGLGGRDHIYGGAGDDRICLGPGDPPKDLLDLQSARGGGGHDRIAGGRHPEYLRGGSGNDVIRAGGGGDHVNGGRGADRIWGGSHHDRLNGGPGDDRVWGQGGPDAFEASPGNDIFVGGSNGASGDNLTFHTARGPAYVDLAAGQARAKGLGRDELHGIEGVIGTRYGDRIRGDDGPNSFFSLDGDDQLWGLGGDDCFLPSFGSNSIDGGSGFDTYSADPLYRCFFNTTFNGPITDRNNGVTVDLVTGEAAAEGEATAMNSIEGAIGGPQGDILLGDDGDNQLFGGGGGDDIDGRGGDDELDGGGGEDTVDGGEGHDVCLNAEVFLNCEEGPLGFLLRQT